MGSILNGDPLDLDWHGNAATLVTESGRHVNIRRFIDGEVRLSIHTAIGVNLTADEADQIAYELACAALAARDGVPSASMPPCAACAETPPGDADG